jgi:hypothetical protein
LYKFLICSMRVICPAHCSCLMLPYNLDNI